MISKDTATDIALVYREIERAEELLADVENRRSKWSAPDIRDAFGRQQPGLTLGIPSSESSRNLYNIPWELCKPMIDLHIAHQRARLAVLCEAARLELGPPSTLAASPTADPVANPACCQPEGGNANG